MTHASPIAQYRRRQTPRMTQTAFGQLFDKPVHPSTVCRWEREGVDADRALEIEQITGIPREVLLPHLFKAPARDGLEAAE